VSGRTTGFAVTISAVDQASKQIDAINKRIAAMQRPVLRMQASLSKFADVSGLTKMGRSFEQLGQFAFRAFQNISRIVEPLAAITGAASVAGLFRVATAFGDFGQKLQNAARRSGETTDQLQVLQGAARLAGSSGESLTAGMTHMNDTLTDVVAGRAPEVAVMMNTLGISFRDQVTGGARKAIDVLPELADRIARLQNPALQARAATALLGGAAEDLLPFLRRGAAGIAEYTQLARKYGVVNEEAAAKGVVLHRAQTELTMSVEGLSNAIGEKLAPILTPVLQGMADWIAANRTWIATQIGEKVQELATYLKSIDWKTIGADALAFGEKVKDLIDDFGGVRKVAEGLLTFMVTRWVVGMLASVVQVTTAVGVGLVGAFNLAQAAAFKLNAEMQSNPTFRTLTALLNLYDKLQSGIDLQGLSADSPLWNAVPPEVQQRYQNSPANHGGGGAGSGVGEWWKSHAPTWLGGSKPQAPLAPDVEKEIRAKAAAIGLDPDHMVHLAQAEHGGYNNVSPAGARGPMQLMPGTAAQMGVDPSDWHQNVTGGLAYYKQQLDRFGGHYALADAAYNAGPANPGVLHYAATGDASHMPRETQDYVTNVAQGQPEPDIAKPSAQGPSLDVGGGTGAPTSDVTHTINGKADVNVNIAGGPAGTTATAKTDGALFGQPRVSMAMPGLGP
jgi:hypothetical protein